MKLITISSILLTAISSVSSGELRTGSQTVSFTAGGAFSGSEFGQDITGNPDKHEKIADSGGAAGGQYLYYLRGTPAVGVGVDILHSGLQEHQANSINSQYNFKTRFQPTTVMAIAKLAFGSGRIHPYLFGGLGFHRTSFYWDFQPKGGTVWPDTGGQENRRIIEGTGTGFASAAGLGLDIFVTPSFFIGGEARGAYLGSETYHATEDARSIGFTGPDPHGDLVAFNLLVRIGIKFGS